VDGGGPDNVIVIVTGLADSAAPLILPQSPSRGALQAGTSLRD
jgi:hypothetical protein